MPEILAKNKLMMRVSMGEAKIDDTETLGLSTTLHGAPVIQFEDGTIVYWAWEELIEEAIKLKEREIGERMF